MLVKNTDPYKLKKCTICKNDIVLNERYFAYPLSLQQICFGCAKEEIPKIMQALKKDLSKIEEENKKVQ